MGAKPTKSKYTHSNLVLEYHFNLNEPKNRQPKVIEKVGASLYEFHPDAQDEVFDDVKHLIRDGDERMANTYIKYKRCNYFGRLFVLSIILSSIAYVALTLYQFLPSFQFLWTITAAIIVVTSLLSATYCLFFVNKAKNKSQRRWRKSIITQISTKSLEWQSTNPQFAFTVVYPIGDIDHSNKGKLTNIGGILRITLGLPKVTREPIYFQATPRKKILKQHSRKYHSMYMMPSLKQSEVKAEAAPGVALEIYEHKNNRSKYKRSHKGSKSSFNVLKKNSKHSLNKNNKHIGAAKSFAGDALNNWNMNNIMNGQEEMNNISPIKKHHHPSQSVVIHKRCNYNFGKRENSGSGSKSNAGLLGHDKPKLDICRVSNSSENYDDERNEFEPGQPIKVEPKPNPKKEMISNLSLQILKNNNNGKHQSHRYNKTLPIMIAGIHGPRLLLQGTKTIINGQEVILIENNPNDNNLLVQQLQHDIAEKELGITISNRSAGPMPVSPIDPDMSFNNDIVLPMTYTYTESNNIAQAFKYQE
eukprot:75045_1